MKCPVCGAEVLHVIRYVNPDDSIGEAIMHTTTKGVPRKPNCQVPGARKPTDKDLRPVMGNIIRKD